MLQGKSNGQCVLFRVESFTIIRHTAQVVASIYPAIETMDAASCVVLRSYVGLSSWAQRAIRRIDNNWAYGHNCYQFECSIGAWSHWIKKTASVVKCKPVIEGLQAIVTVSTNCPSGLKGRSFEKPELTSQNDARSCINLCCYQSNILLRFVKSLLASQAFSAWRANCGSSDCHLQTPPNRKTPLTYLIWN